MKPLVFGRVQEPFADHPTAHSQSAWTYNEQVDNIHKCQRSKLETGWPTRRDHYLVQHIALMMTVMVASRQHKQRRSIHTQKHGISSCACEICRAGAINKSRNMPQRSPKGGLQRWASSKLQLRMWLFSSWDPCKERSLADAHLSVKAYVPDISSVQLR